MITCCVKNGLVVGVIVLFIGVGIQPAFAIKPDTSELIEITVEICKLNGVHENTVMLTSEQTEELENLINNFEIELDDTDSIDETEAIFKDTIVSLNELKLLPNSIVIEDAQHLVTGKEQNPIIVKILERYYSNNKKSLDNNENTLCLIAGFTSHTYFLGPIGRILYYLIDFLPWEPLLVLILVFLLSAN